MALETSSSRSISRALTTTIDGQEKTVAQLNGAVMPGKGITLSVILVDAQLANENAADMAQAVKSFWTELRQAATESGLPV